MTERENEAREGLLQKLREAYNDPDTREDAILEAEKLGLRAELGWPMFEYDTSFTGGREHKRIRQTIGNVVEALSMDKEIAGKIAFNELSFSPYIIGRLPWMEDDGPREWTNADDSFLRQWLEKYGLKHRQNTEDGLVIVYKKNRINPVREELEAIHRNRWDKKTGHIRRLLPEYLGADDSEYNYQVMRLLMVAAVKRIYEPGCKFDNMAVLVGPQGIGKSTFIRRLALRPEWITDNFNSFETDKAVAMLRGLWIVEVGELSAMKRARELETVKAFISSSADVYREPYKAKTENRPRRCIFIGSTNDMGFLTDKTGNRRFLPIQIGVREPSKSLFDMDAVNVDFRNAWGEALDIYLQNPAVELILPKEAADEALRQQENYMADDPRAGIIENYLRNRRRLGPVCVAEIHQLALENPGLPTRHESNELHQIMQKMAGWRRLEKKTRCGNYGPQIAYEPVPNSEPEGPCWERSEQLASPFLSLDEG